MPGTETHARAHAHARAHTHAGKRWESPPECGSAQFDADGKCVALTGGYIMDRRMGNTEGLGVCVCERERERYEMPMQSGLFPGKVRNKSSSCWLNDLVASVAAPEIGATTCRGRIRAVRGPWSGASVTTLAGIHDCVSSLFFFSCFLFFSTPLCRYTRLCQLSLLLLVGAFLGLA